MQKSAHGGRRLSLPNTHPAWQIRWPLLGVAGFTVGMGSVAIVSQYVSGNIGKHPGTPQVLAAQDSVFQNPPVVETSQSAPGIFLLNARDINAIAETTMPTINLVLLVITFMLFLGISVRRVIRSIRKKKASPQQLPDVGSSQGYVAHYKTGQRIEGVSVVVYDKNKRVLMNERTGPDGAFSTLYPAGEYFIGVDAPGMEIASSMALGVRPKQGILYSGGKLVVAEGGDPLFITIPLKPAQEPDIAESFSMRWRLRLTHYTTHIFFTVLVIAMTFNLILIFLDLQSTYIIIGIIYILLAVGFAITTPHSLRAHGLVRDAVNHKPVELAVVRLFTGDSHKLVQTQVSNSQGNFRLNPASGKYTLAVAKSGFAPYSKNDIVMSDIKRTKKIIVDLMPIKPKT